jgi:hypothetical protein
MTARRPPAPPAQRRALAAALCFLPGLVLAQVAPADHWRSVPAFARIGYETITLPGDERMGLVGMSYLVEARPGLCLGPAVYGAASGQRGGFFTIGADAALCTRLYGPLSLQAGLYVGGGGGAAAPVGGGLMLRPYANLLWDFGGFSAGVSVSNVRFPNGDIQSSQIGVVLDAPLKFTTLPVGSPKPRRYTGTPTGVGFDRVLAVAGVYSPRGGSLGVSGAPLPAQIGYVGARAETFLRYHVYAGVEANGAASGGVDGYAEILGTLGTEYLLGDSGVTLGARVALGMGGGGDMPMGGGLLGKAALDLGIPLSRDLSLGLEAGWAGAPQGDFSAPFGSLSLRWALDPLLGVPPTVVREEWAAGVELYQDAARKNGSSHSMQNLSFKYTRFVGASAYLTGQVQSAYQGNAGAYTAGLFGVGGQWRFDSGLLAGAEMLAGAAGGGGVDTGSGAIVKPMAYVGAELSPALSLRLGAGWVKALNGELSSAVADLTLVYAFGVAGRP